MPEISPIMWLAVYSAGVLMEILRLVRTQYLKKVTKNARAIGLDLDDWATAIGAGLGVTISVSLVIIFWPAMVALRLFPKKVS